MDSTKACLVFCAAQEELPCPVPPPACAQDTRGEPPLFLSTERFLGAARWHLLRMGIMKPINQLTPVQVQVRKMLATP
jgi:hypothetical protein